MLKYDLKNIFKFLIIFYSLALFFGILTRIFLNIENSLIMNIIGQICSGTAISMMFSILINNMMRLWVRFKSNFYGDESYLTHTLPINKTTLYLSKSLTAIITLFVSMTIIGLTIFIAYSSKEFFETIKTLLFPIATAYNSTIIRIIISLIFILFLEFSNILQCGFTGLILGHRRNINKIFFSVLYGFGVYLISQVFVLLVIFIFALFNKDILNLIFTNQMISIEATKTIVYISTIIYMLTLFIMNYINIKLFNKGVNVD